MIAMDIEKIFVRLDNCKDCNWNLLEANIRGQVKQAKNLLSAWDKTECIEIVDQLEQSHKRTLWDAHNPPLSRRDLFRLATRQGKATLAQAVERDHNKGAKIPGRDRRRIINAINHFTNPESNLKNPLSETFAVLSVNESCTACGTCARSCPTSAISFKVK